MAEVVDNKKGFLIIKMSHTEAAKMGFGIGQDKKCICMMCNMVIKEPMYYVSVLNDVMCEECYKRWISKAEKYEEDSEFEESNFVYYAQLLGIEV